jgi:tetratricopeptide (TPR) repeat protein
MADKIQVNKKLLEKAITQNPADTASLYQLGKLALQSKDYVEAERLMQQAVGFAPNNPDYLVGFGQVVLANTKARSLADRLQKAEGLFARAARLAPTHLKANQALAFLAAEQHLWEKAESSCQTLLKIAPKDARSHKLRIGVLDRDNTRRPAVQAEFERYLALVPTDADSTLHFVQFLSAETPPPKAKPAKKKQWEDAQLAHMLTLLETNILATGDGTGDAGKLYGQLSLSVVPRRQAFMARLEARYPAQKKTLLYLAHLAKLDGTVDRLGSRKSIIRLYEKALRLDKNDRTLWLALGEQYELVKDIPKAIQAYTEVARRNQSDDTGKAASEALKILKKSK